MPTLISHFYNEAFLLPFWLKHHKKLFKDAILIDYASTDDSVEIIKKICPHWQIVPSKNASFDAIACDEEVKEYEATISGWKMCLNTTEFLFVNNLEDYLKDKEQYNGVLTQGIIVVESEEERKKPLNNLLTDRHTGYLEPPRGYLDTGILSRSRLIHKLSNGMYTIGRHTTLMPNTIKDDNFLLLWFGYCPFSISWARKSAINSRFPPHAARFVKEEWDRLYIEYQNKSYDLLTIPAYKKTYLKLKKIFC